MAVFPIPGSNHHKMHFVPLWPLGNIRVGLPSAQDGVFLALASWLVLVPCTNPPGTGLPAKVPALRQVPGAELFDSSCRAPAIPFPAQNDPPAGFWFEVE